MTLTVLGVATLLGLGVLLWQRRASPLAVASSEPQALEEHASEPIHRVAAGTDWQAAQWDEALRSARRVDLNAADIAELERLPKVGPVLARRIVAYRETHGGFQTPEELTRVPGIGPKMYEALEDYVTAK
jgi:competence ComEA-like helix-hairpin-helix protein